jgi:plastocyanin
MTSVLRRYLLAGAAASAVFGGWVGGCSERPGDTSHAAAAETAAAAGAPERRVTIDNFAFDPPLLVVTPGTRVTWLNRDDVPHTATSSASPPRFNSRAIDTDQTFSYVFTRPGNYPYFCAVHPKMTATVVVK